MIKKIGTVIIALITIFITVAAFYLVILVILNATKAEPEDPEKYQDVTIASKRKEHTGMSCYELLFTTQCDIKYAYYVNNTIVSESDFYSYQEGKTYSCYKGKIGNSCKLKENK